MTDAVQLRMTKADKRSIEAAAELLHVPLAEFIRSVTTDIASYIRLDYKTFHEAAADQAVLTDGRETDE